MPWFPNGRRVVFGLRVAWIILILWYELGTFTHHVRQCTWPDASLLPHSSTTPVHVLIVADPQILDSRSYPDRSAILTYLSQLFTDLNLRKSWRAALATRPDVVVFLGDMMDGGRMDMSDKENEDYFKRFRSIFRISSDILCYFVPGNHDIGLGISASFSPDARSRYISHFGAVDRVVSIANHTVVLLDAPGLADENYRRGNDDSQPIPGGTVEFAKNFAKENLLQPVVLFSHIPLSRPDDADCGPLRERGTIRRGTGIGYQNTLGKDASGLLLESFEPSIIFSGDDHDYCEYTHTFRLRDQPTSIREVTVKSLSMAMGIQQPGFQLLSLASTDGPATEITSNMKSFADKPCLMPNQLEIYLSVYIRCLVASVFILVLTNIRTLHISYFSRAHSKRSDDSRRGPLTESSETLPHPVSSATGVPRIGYSSLGRDRRVRVPFGTALPASLLGWSSPAYQGAKHGPAGFRTRFLRDVRDVAVWPVGIFAVVSWWMFFN